MVTSKAFTRPVNSKRYGLSTEIESFDLSEFNHPRISYSGTKILNFVNPTLY